MVWKKLVDSLTNGIPHSDTRFLGLKIGLVGYLVGMLGIAVLFSGIENAGKLIVYFGAAIGVVGFITQAIIMLFKPK